MLIEGKKIAEEIQAEIKRKIASFQGRKPGLAFILVGDNPASESYVGSKRKACASVGIISTVIEFAKTVPLLDLFKAIDQCNRNSAIDGILIQLPLPSHIDEKAIAARVDPAKDVDGFHPLNVGKMLLGEEGGFLPCTPQGIQVLLEKYQIPVEGKHVVILGRSNIVGKPLAAILMQKKRHCNATVTVAHSQSENLPALMRSADILVAAIGRPLFVKKEMVKPGAAIIDVGINRTSDGKLVGDVDFQGVSEVASAITPVPGGVGPMTIAMLLQNTLWSFLKTFFFLFLLASCQNNTASKDLCTHFEGSKRAMPYRVTVGKPLSQKEQKTVANLIEYTFSDMEKIFDCENPNSEISRLNAAGKDALVPLSKPLQDLLTLCQDITALSGGRFDPAIAPLEKLWRDRKDFPPPEQLQAACDASGWHHISIHNGIFKKDCPETKLDLFAVFKGLCVDWLVDRLQKMGYADLMVEWAGAFRALGHHPENRDWTVEIDPSWTMNQQPIAPIALRNCALAANYHRHLIDPLSASPLQSSIAFASVIAPSCALADALATAALLFYSRKEAEKWAQEVVELYPEVSFWILSHGNLSFGSIRQEIQDSSEQISSFGAEGKGGPPPLPRRKRRNLPEELEYPTDRPKTQVREEECH